MTKEERVEWVSGVQVTTKETRLVLDPIRSGGFERGTHRFISHAHADHTQSLSTHEPKYQGCDHPGAETVLIPGIVLRADQCDQGRS